MPAIVSGAAAERNESPRESRLTAYNWSISAPGRNESRFLSVPEAAILLGVTAPTVRAWIRDGRIRAVRPGGELGQLRVPVAEIDRLAEPERAA